MEAVLWRLAFSVVYGFAIIIAFNTRDDRERKVVVTEKVPRSTAYVAEAAIYLVLFGMIWWVGNKTGWGWMKDMGISLFVSISVHMAVYDVILVYAMPKLRRRISARACGYLWLLPFFSFAAMNSSAAYSKPLVHISLPNTVAKVLFWVWLTGFAGVLLWKIFTHVVFRRQILKDTWQPDAGTRDLWMEEQQRAGGVNMNYPLLVSPHVNTPLSIGAFRWSIRVVLPERSFTEEELRLIFRHELVHINRGDSGNKFMRTFFAAVCWFNPLMWKAMHSSAEDMELSCDETVLLDETEEIRQRYARLLLSTAGDERGFTTCLAASAQAMRYRLKNVVQPAERESGVLVLAGIFMVVLMTFGWFSLGYEQLSGHELIFQGQDLSLYSVADEEGISESGGEALTAYLADLEFEKITGKYGGVSRKIGFDVAYQGPEGKFRVTFLDEQILIRPYYGNRTPIEVRCCSEIDWDYLNSFAA